MKQFVEGVEKLAKFLEFVGGWLRGFKKGYQNIYRDNEPFKQPVENSEAQDEQE